MNPNIETLTTLPYVRRVVRSSGDVGVLTDKTVGLHDKPDGLRGVSFHAPMSVVGPAECEVLWDSLAAELRTRLKGVPGVVDVRHRWCGEDETVEVEVGRSVSGGGEHEVFSARETEARPIYAEGVYAVTVEPQPEDEAKAAEAHAASFLSLYLAEQRKRYEAACEAVRENGRDLFYRTRDALTRPKRESDAAFKKYVQEHCEALLRDMELADTPTKRQTYIRTCKASETPEEKAEYLANAALAACVERVQAHLGDLPEPAPWGVEIIPTQEADERYLRLP